MRPKGASRKDRRFFLAWSGFGSDWVFALGQTTCWDIGAKPRIELMDHWKTDGWVEGRMVGLIMESFLPLLFRFRIWVLGSRQARQQMGNHAWDTRRRRFAFFLSGSNFTLG
ncbi:hypothetical protein B0T22DRAFT_155851 [Podospora appendiculata]|uniref:Uncharacterized protein n=1 Tax=Podospora appendiculata TaxID=314037 RepID=A0AAE1CCD5_9PEZI|nr:hypothetical protein B0T22DRAFT_155851 [Podospora appendiculata]